MAAIEARGLTKRYRRTLALDNVDLEIPEGSVYALVGANGAGKTTLIRLLMNILQPSSGMATVLGISSTEMAGRGLERIGYVSENQETVEGFTVQELLDYVRPFYPMWDRELESEVVQQFALPLRRKLKHLSRGMKMKAALASVLPYRPSLIVLDEPFSGLDPLVRDELIESLRTRDKQTTIVLSPHDLSEIESFATHVGYLAEGRLLFSETLSELVNRFRSIEAVLSPTAPAPASDFPSTWLNVEKEGRVVRFVESGFSALTSAELAARLPDVNSLTVETMSLRAIFVAIAKSNRTLGDTAANEGRSA